MRTVLYNDADHSYTVDGVPAVSVTTIAKAVSGLSYGTVPAAVLEAARERGNAIHADVESLAFSTPEGKFVYEKLYANNHKVELIVGGFIDGVGVGGRVDLIGTTFDDHNITDEYLADVKTTYDLNRAYCIIQLNLYRFLAAKAYIHEAEKLLIFHVPKSGKYKVVELPILPPEKISEIISAYKQGVIMSEKDLTQTTELSVVAQSLNVSELTSEQLFAKIGELTKNAEQARQIVKQKLADYSADNYSEENIQEAKDDKATLNNFSKTLNGHRIELEKKWLEPFDKFKGIIAETCGTVKDASGKIDEIVKTVEKREIDKKMSEIENYFIKLDCTLFPLSKIFNQKWLNKGAKLKDIENEIQLKIVEVEQNLKIIDRLNEPDVKAYYLETLDITAAMSEADRLKTNRERLAAVEAERNGAAREKIEEGGYVPPSEIAPAESADVSASEAKAELLERTFWIQATEAQIIALGNFMNANGIVFKKL